MVLCSYNDCFYAGIDLVHDQVEQALLCEVENLRACQDRLKKMHEKTVDQVR